MSTMLIGGFLIIHGLLHLAIWLPPADPGAPKPPPFVPDHSAILTATVRTLRPRTVHRLSIALAGTTAAAYVLAGLAHIIGAPVVIGLAIAGGVLGLVLKAVYFHPWLSIGVVLDLAVLSAALFDWPVSLS